MSSLIKCPNCGAPKTINIDTRDTPPNRVRRRKKCPECGTHFTTYEVYVPDGEDPNEMYEMFRRGYRGKIWTR